MTEHRNWLRTVVVISRNRGVACIAFSITIARLLRKLSSTPLSRKQVNLGKSDQFQWTNQFFAALTKKRKVALRRGEELETQRGYTLKSKPLKQLCNGAISVSDLTEDDFLLEITQKGVDMRIGLDIASLAERGTVNQIVMITGESDFVPAAKHARREGIDFVLDPLWATVTRA